jgi:hypothetical protein
LFDAIAKQEYYDTLKDVDGNDNPNLMGILTGSDIFAADEFFKRVYKKMVDHKNENAFGPAAGGDGGAAAYGVSGDPNVLFADSDNDD